MEYRPTYIEGVEVSRSGDFIVNGKSKPLKHHKSGFYLCFGGSKGRVYLHASQLVASAWCDGWFKGCYIRYKDDDKFNIDASNLVPLNGRKYLEWRGERISVEKAKAEQMRRCPKFEEYGRFKSTGVLDIECTEDGIFRRGNKLLEVCRYEYSGKKFTAYLSLVVSKKRYKFIAGDLVARAWSPNVYFEGCYVLYKDGDRHNIHNDNLILATETEFFKKRNTNRRKPVEFVEVEDMAKTMQKECELFLDYLKTGEMDGINKYIQSSLIGKMRVWMMKTFKWEEEKRNEVLYEALTFLYMRIDANRPFIGFEKYLKLIIYRYRREKGWGVTEIYPPRKIENYVSLLKNDSLCKKMKVGKIK